MYKTFLTGENYCTDTHMGSSNLKAVYDIKKSSPLYCVKYWAPLSPKCDLDLLPRSVTHVLCTLSQHSEHLETWLGIKFNLVLKAYSNPYTNYEKRRLFLNE